MLSRAYELRSRLRAYYEAEAPDDPLRTHRAHDRAGVWRRRLRLVAHLGGADGGLGVPERMGASQVGGHAHCAFPASQRAELAAFVDKFMLDDAAADTNVLRSDRITPDRARWIPWTTPALE